LILSYSFAINNVFVTTLPSWLTLNESVTPPQLEVYSTDPASFGFYTIQIFATLNKWPVISADSQIFTTLTITGEFCGTIRFDPQADVAINFTIKDGQPDSTLTFADFTDSSGQMNCGPREYYVLIDHSSLTFDAATRTLSVQSADPSTVGTHEVVFVGQLLNYP